MKPRPPAVPPAPTKPAPKPPAKPPKPAPPPGINPVLLIAIAALAIATTALVIVLVMRRKSAVPVALSDVEKSILETLRSSGGAAYQYELQRRLGIPKSTLWKVLRRLERRGLIIIEKVGRYNFVKLRTRI